MLPVTQIYGISTIIAKKERLYSTFYPVIYQVCWPFLTVLRYDWSSRDPQFQEDLKAPTFLYKVQAIMCKKEQESTKPQLIIPTYLTEKMNLEKKTTMKRKG